MSDDCFFNPSACEEEPAPEPVAANDEAKAEEMPEGGEDELAEEWAEVEAWMEETSGDRFMAQLVFLLSSGVIAGKAFVDLFLYVHASECAFFGAGDDF